MLTVSCSTGTQSIGRTTLKDAYAGKFYIGTALNENQITGKDTASDKIVKEQFNAIVAENIMKSEVLQPKEGEFNFNMADKFVEFGEQNNMFITGHTLIWHEQASKWFFTDSLGNDVSREVLIERMRNHISTVVGRYKGRVKGWDVVNEAIVDDGSYRNSKFYQIIGEDFIRLAFEFAHEADPDAELYYNDFGMDHSGKREGVVEMVKKLKRQGVQINGIGMQSHIGLNYPPISEYEASIKAYAALGVKVMITELDLSVLPLPDHRIGADVSTNIEYQKKLNPYPQSLPDSMIVRFENRYLDFFRLFLNYENSISRVTFWGVNDTQSWKNNWPVRGRKDYPLLFDRMNNAKPVVDRIIELTNK